MEGKAGSKLNLCQALEKQQKSVPNEKNDAKMAKIFINPTQAQSPPHPFTPGFWPQNQIT